MPDAPREQKRPTAEAAENTNPRRKTAWIYFSMFYWIIQDICEKLCEKYTKTGLILTLIFSTDNL